MVRERIQPVYHRKRPIDALERRVQSLVAPCEQPAPIEMEFSELQIIECSSEPAHPSTVQTTIVLISIVQRIMLKSPHRNHIPAQPWRTVRNSSRKATLSPCRRRQKGHTQW